MTEGEQRLQGFDPDGLTSIGICEEDATLLTRHDGRWWVRDLPADPVAVGDLIAAWRDGVPARRVEDGEVHGVALSFFDRTGGGLRLRVDPPGSDGLSTVSDGEGTWVIETPRPDLLRCGEWRWMHRDGLRERAGEVLGLELEVEGAPVALAKGDGWATGEGAPLDEAAALRLVQRWMLAQASPPHDGPVGAALATGVIRFPESARLNVEVGADWVRFGDQTPRALPDAGTLIPDLAALAER